MSMNRPSEVLFAAISLSPCRTWISTLFCPSAAVENTWDLRVGMVVFLSMSLVEMPPSVSMPKRQRRNVQQQDVLDLSGQDGRLDGGAHGHALHRVDAPLDLLAHHFSTNFWTSGMRVGPPTRMTLSILSWVRLASFSAFWTGARQRSTTGSISSSSVARVMVEARCFGPSASAEMKGRLISVDMVVESSILAFSQASRTLHMAILSEVRSTPDSFWNSWTTNFMRISSMSVPPSWVSPLVETTSKTPSREVHDGDIERSAAQVEDHDLLGRVLPCPDRRPERPRSAR